MINKFEKQLEKWNNGVLRGAQAKLAKRLQVSTATVALWTTGKRHPSKGYIHQLAKIFGMDDYLVSRLFLSISPIVSAPWSIQPNGLHDSGDSSITYSTDNFLYNSKTKNSISLPFFTHLPPHLPQYQETQVADRWILPRQITQGAQFLIHANQTDLSVAHNDDILFITPSAQWIQGTWMLARQGKKYLIRKILYQNKELKWAKKGKTTSIPAQAEPIGIVVKKLTNHIF